MSTLVSRLRVLAVALVLVAPLPLVAQAATSVASTAMRPLGPSATPWRVTLTLFRSPGTGVQLSRGKLAVFAAHYPTIFERDGGRRTTHFVRLGVAGYLRPEAATSPYVSLSVAPSLTKGWSTSGLVDVGVRQSLAARLSGQLGVAVLYAPAREATRVNPTIGLGVSF